MNNTARLAAIDDLLKEVPAFQCIEGCSDCCGPVMMSTLEWRRLIKVTGDPKLPNKMRAAAESAMEAQHANCPLLDAATHKCTVYEHRPAICRVFGASEAATLNSSLVCPHGRKPEKPLSKEQTNRILDRVEFLGHRHVGF